MSKRMAGGISAGRVNLKPFQASDFGWGDFDFFAVFFFAGVLLVLVVGIV
jgi:hypothetical protein